MNSLLIYALYAKHQELPKKIETPRGKGRKANRARDSGVVCESFLRDGSKWKHADSAQRITCLAD